MRVLLDPDLLLGSLLTPQRDNATAAVVEAGILGAYTLLYVEPLWQELGRKLWRKPFLRQRLFTEELEQFSAVMRQAGAVVKPINSSLPRVVAEAGADYLLAHAIVGRADYLVTEARDLLRLDEAVETGRILTPRAFVEQMGEW